MANLTYEERLALERERDRLRREREDERRNGVAGTRANDSRIVGNDNAMRGRAGRKWLGGESGSVSDGSSMHGKAGRKWLGLGGSQDEEPRRSNISVYSNVDQLNGRAPTVYEAGSDDDPTKEWTTAGLRQKAINAQRLLDQFKAGKNQQLQDAANSANADNEVLGRLFLSAFQTPRQLGADGRPMNTDMDANDIAQIVGNNQRFAGISRAGIRMQDLGDGKKVPVLIYEKGGQTYMLDPNQAFAAANAFTGSQKATLSAISGKGLAGAFGATSEKKPSAVDVANARGEQGFFNAALNTAMKNAISEDADGNSTFNQKMFDAAFDSAIAAYKRAFGGGTAAPAPTGGNDGKGANAVGTTLTKEQLEKQKQGGAIQMDQKGKTQNAATTAQPAQTQPAAPKDTAGVVEDAKPKYRGGQQQLDLLISDDNEANGYRRLTTNGYIGNDGKFYDGRGQQIEGVVGTFKTDYERDENGKVVRNEKGNPAKYVYTDSKFNDELEKRKQKQGASNGAIGDNGATQQTQAAAKPNAAQKTSTSTSSATAPKGGERPKITGRRLNEDRRKRNRFDFAEHYGVSESVLAEYQRLNPTANISRDNSKAANEMANLARLMGENDTADRIASALKNDSGRRNSILSKAMGYANERANAEHEKSFDDLEARVRDEITKEAIAKGKDKAWIDREIVARIDNGVRRQRRNASAALGNANPSEDDLRRAEGEYSREKAISDTMPTTFYRKEVLDEAGKALGSLDARRMDDRDEFYGFTTGGHGGKSGKPPRTLADIQRDIDAEQNGRTSEGEEIVAAQNDGKSDSLRLIRRKTADETVAKLKGALDAVHSGIYDKFGGSVKSGLERFIASANKYVKSGKAKKDVAASMRKAYDAIRAELAKGNDEKKRKEVDEIVKPFRNMIPGMNFAPFAE